MGAGEVVKGARVHPLAWVGFTTAVLALLLAWYGSLHAEKHIAGSPLRQARGSAGLPAGSGPWYVRLADRAEVGVFGDRLDAKILAWTERSKVARYSLQVVAFVLPFVLGVAAAVIGAFAMKAIERSGGKYMGNFLSVFAIMIGGFAAIIGGCMMLSIYVWPHLPSIYTT
jgi:hypothetical protein